MKLKISYNAPVVLSFTLLSALVYFLNYLIYGDLNENQNSLIGNYFTLVPNSSWYDWKSYIRLFTYTLGHANLDHIVGNFSLFLLLAPIMEEKYGSRDVLLMMLITSILTGIFHLIFFNAALLGASGLVFMFIVLVSFADAKDGSIPLTFILVILFFIGKEIMNATHQDNISQYAHILGGIMGTVFGFAASKEKKITTGT
jgi:rhomboid protease GluP